MPTTKSRGSDLSTARLARLPRPISLASGRTSARSGTARLRDIVNAHGPDDIGDQARVFALASYAAADAMISAFTAKYHYNFWRPITAIQEGDVDGNPRTDGEPNWVPFLTTPAYPDHPSGANNVTGAFTTILQLFYGTDELDFTVPRPDGGDQPAYLPSLLGRPGGRHQRADLSGDSLPVRGRGCAATGCPRGALGLPEVPEAGTGSKSILKCTCRDDGYVGPRNELTLAIFLSVKMLTHDRRFLEPVVSAVPIVPTAVLTLDSDFGVQQTMFDRRQDESRFSCSIGRLAC